MKCKRLMLALLLVGCAADRIGTAEPAPAPLIGAKADTFADVADHECRVVLRHVEPAGGAVRATLDVAQSLLNDPGATAAVLFRADGSGWQSIDATAVEGAPAGFRRFQAQIAEASSLDLLAYARTTPQV